MFEGLTYQEIIIELLLINLMTVAQAIDYRIEFEARILTSYSKN